MVIPVHLKLIVLEERAKLPPFGGASVIVWLATDVPVLWGHRELHKKNVS